MGDSSLPSPTASGSVDPESGAGELFAGLGEPPDVRSNESKCDPAGRLLVGTMAFDYLPIGSLYSVEADGSVKRLLDSLSIANGMAWTEDGGTFYYIDSPLRRVDAFDYDLATGAISGRRPYLTFDDRVAKPDGMSIDAEGGLWIAFWDAGEIRRYGPDRALDVVVHVPATQVTSGVFGGPDLRDLYITTATTELPAEALAEQPHAGGLFHVRSAGPRRAPAPLRRLRAPVLVRFSPGERRSAIRRHASPHEHLAGRSRRLSVARGRRSPCP